MYAALSGSKDYHQRKKGEIDPHRMLQKAKKGQMGDQKRVWVIPTYEMD